MPKLKAISHDPNAGQCSLCREVITVPSEPAADVTKRLREVFDRHVREKHPAPNDHQRVH